MDDTEADDPLREVSSEVNKLGDEDVSQKIAPDAGRRVDSDSQVEVSKTNVAAIEPEPLAISPEPASHDDELDFDQWIETPPGFEPDLLDRLDVKEAATTDGYIPQQDECVFYLHRGEFRTLVRALACSTPKDSNQSVSVRLTFESHYIKGRSYHNSTFTSVSVCLAQSGHFTDGLQSITLVFSFDDLQATESGVDDLIRFTYMSIKRLMNVCSGGFERPLQIERHERFIDHSQDQEHTESLLLRVGVSREIFLRCLLHASSQSIMDHVVDYTNIIQFQSNVAGGGSFRAFAYAASEHLNDVSVVIHHRFLPFMIRFLDPGFSPEMTVADTGSYYILEADRVSFGFEKTWQRKDIQTEPSKDNAPVEQKFRALMLFSEEYNYRYNIVLPTGALLPVLTALKGGIGERDVEIRLFVKDTERIANCIFSVEDDDGKMVSFGVSVDRRDTVFDSSIIDIKLSLDAFIAASRGMSGASYVHINIIDTPQFIILEDDFKDFNTKTIIAYSTDLSKNQRSNRRQKS